MPGADGAEVEVGWGGGAGVADWLGAGMEAAVAVGVVAVDPGGKALVVVGDVAGLDELCI